MTMVQTNGGISPIPSRNSRLYIGVVAVAALLILPGVLNLYWVHIATLAFVYWVLVAGLNLLVGFAGQLAIGSVGLLAIGAYTASILCEKAGWNPYAAMLAAGAVGGVFGFLVGLPALRLKTFYFAMATLGFATIVSQVALGWESVTGGGIGLSGPVFPAPFDTDVGFYYLTFIIATLATFLLRNIAVSSFGRGLVAMRDVEVAAEAVGVPLSRLKLMTFAFGGTFAGVAGSLYAARQSYITPDAFTFDLSILFFIAVLIGGRGRLLGPMIGTAVLTLLPEIAAPLAAWATFTYGALLLVVALAVPGGIAEFIERYLIRRPPATGIEPPKIDLLSDILPVSDKLGSLALKGAELAFGGLKALDRVDLAVEQGEIHSLIGPNGSGKTTALNVLSGYYPVQNGGIFLGTESINGRAPSDRAGMRIARTFQKPRVVGNLNVLENAMLGGYGEGSSSFLATAAGLPASRKADGEIRERALQALAVVGLSSVADHRAEELQHTGQRLLEIARCLVMRPQILLLDEPAAGLSMVEIEHLKDIIVGLRDRGCGVLLVEHHADLVFNISDRVTVLNLGRVLATGKPTEIRSNAEVIQAYLGS